MNTSIFIGRENQLNHLFSEYVKIARQSKVSVQFVTGEMGMGKTVLVNEFLKRLYKQQEQTIALSASCFTQSNEEVPYYVFKELLNNLIAPPPNESITKSWKKQLLVKATEKLMSKAPDLIGSLIPGGKLIQNVAQFALEETGLLNKLKEKIQGKKIEQIQLDDIKISYQYAQFFKNLAQDHPIVIVIDDMQWMDSASAGLIQKMMKEVCDCPILFVLLYRSTELENHPDESRHPLRALINNTQAALNAEITNLDELTNDEKKQFTSSFLSRFLPGIEDDFVHHFHQKTDGHPLYTSELLLMLKENGVIYKNDLGRWEAKAITYDQLPNAMAGIMRERIERLSQKYRKWLDIATIQGETFYIRVIAEMEDLSPHEVLFEFSKILDRQLNLVEETGLQNSGNLILPTYRFSNKLIREYIYQDISQGERIYLHRKIAETLESIFKDVEEDIYIDLAHHYDEAHCYDQAYDYYIKASQQSFNLGAFKNSTDILRKVLQRLPFFSNSVDIIKKELEVLMLLANSCIAVSGYGTDEINEISQRADVLRKELGDDESLFSILWVRWANVMVQANFEQATWLSQKMSSIASSPDAPNINRVEAFHAEGVTTFNLGDFKASEEALKQSLKAYNPDEAKSHISTFGNDPGILVCNWLSWATLFQGKMEESLDLQKQADEYYYDLTHLSSRSFAKVFKAMWFLFQEDYKNALKTTELALSVMKGELPFWESWATIIQKYTRYRLHQEYSSPESDIQHFINQGGNIWAPYFQCLWAEMSLNTLPDQANDVFKQLLKQIPNEPNYFYKVPILVKVYQWLVSNEQKEDAWRIKSIVEEIISHQKCEFWRSKLDDKHSLLSSSK